jgi:hypothetical protein
MSDVVSVSVPRHNADDTCACSGHVLAILALTSGGGAM